MLSFLTHLELIIFTSRVEWRKKKWKAFSKPTVHYNAFRDINSWLQNGRDVVGVEDTSVIHEGSFNNTKKKYELKICHKGKLCRVAYKHGAAGILYPSRTIVFQWHCWSRIAILFHPHPFSSWGLCSCADYCKACTESPLHSVRPWT
jgi:hypothetical protein